MTEIPPSRYKVVEQGRRLVVIDTRSGREVSHRRTEPVATEKPSLLGTPQQTTFDGRSRLTTHRFYDLKAPRTVILDSGSASLIENARVFAAVAALAFIALAVFFPWILVLLFVFAQPKARDGIKAAVTRWLDRFDQATDSSASAG